MKGAPSKWQSAVKKLVSWLVHLRCIIIHSKYFAVCDRLHFPG